MQLSLVVAMDENGLIGAEGGMPWHMPADLRHFKQTTLNKPILMGRRTHESIGRALPQRDNLILTRDPAFSTPGCLTVATLQAGMHAAAETGSDELMVIGGAQVYALALPGAHQIYLTRIHATFEGDTWFPGLDMHEWEEVSRERRPPDARNAHACSFIQLRRA